MPLVIGHSQFKVMHHYIQDYSILILLYPGSRVDQLWSKLEDIAIITIILTPGCQQPFLIKMASDNRLSAAVFGPKWLVTTGCQQPLPKNLCLVSFNGSIEIQQTTSNYRKPPQTTTKSLQTTTNQLKIFLITI